MNRDNVLYFTPDITEYVLLNPGVLDPQASFQFTSKMAPIERTLSKSSKAGNGVLKACTILYVTVL